MDTIVKKLTEIESAASAIVHHAESQKEVLEREYQAKRKSFDEGMERQTTASVEKIRGELDQNLKKLSIGRENSGDDSITALQKEFEESHTQYAQDILKRITEVS